MQQQAGNGLPMDGELASYSCSSSAYVRTQCSTAVEATPTTTAGTGARSEAGDHQGPGPWKWKLWGTAAGHGRLTARRKFEFDIASMCHG